MRQNILLAILFFPVIISTLCGLWIIPSLIHPVGAEPRNWTVDDDGLADFHTIQEAVDAANHGDIIVVRPGIYGENVFLNKTVTLIGEDRNATIIDGGHSRNVIHAVSPDSVIMNFTVQNSGENPDDSGILLFATINVTIRNNIIKNNNIGVLLRHGSNDTLLIDNVLLNNKASGIRIADNNNFNHVIGNTIRNSTIGVELHASSFNTFYRNNFIHNKVYQAQILGGVSNRWDNGAEGNYWSDYKGLDTNGDGIGDTELPHWVDDHPLIEPWSLNRVFSIELNEETYHVTVQSNSTVASFDFNHSLRRISFNVTGPNGSVGFCRLAVPNIIVEDLWQGNYTVLVDGKLPLDIRNWTNNKYTYLYFTYNHSTRKVVIIPEFVSSLILPLLVISTCVAIVFSKKRPCNTRARK